MGQNCAGPERFLVYETVYNEFCERMVAIVRRMKQGAPLSSSQVVSFFSMLFLFFDCAPHEAGRTALLVAGRECFFFFSMLFLFPRRR